jgi:hypothetical protein
VVVELLALLVGVARPAPVPSLRHPAVEAVAAREGVAADPHHRDDGPAARAARRGAAPQQLVRRQAAHAPPRHELALRHAHAIPPRRAQRQGHPRPPRRRAPRVPQLGQLAQHLRPVAGAPP